MGFAAVWVDLGPLKRHHHDSVMIDSHLSTLSPVILPPPPPPPCCLVRHHSHLCMKMEL